MPHEKRRIPGLGAEWEQVAPAHIAMRMSRIKEDQRPLKKRKSEYAYDKRIASAASRNCAILPLFVSKYPTPHRHPWWCSKISF